MLTGEDIAWIIYSTILIMLSTVLAVRCRNNLLLLPFIVFAILSTISHLVMLSRRYQSDSVILLADRSPIINHIPIFSLLLYAALIECQLVYIQHINTSYQNHHQWNSLGDSDDPEKQQRQRQQQQQQDSHEQQHPSHQNSLIRQKRPKKYWLNVCMLIVYTCLVVALVCVRLFLNDNLGSTRLIMALCISALALLASMNALFVYFAVIPPNAGLHHDACFLKSTSILFSISMIGMAVEAWLFYGMIETHETYNFTVLGWIMFETCLVYLPMFAILVLCLFVRRIHLLGQQQSHTEAEARILRFLRQRRRGGGNNSDSNGQSNNNDDDMNHRTEQQQHQHQTNQQENELRRSDSATAI
ncbi:hypothetical protein BDA99DRAFT_560967 [Phascolomyces articulosus]|uniref:Uncharacterized protein n=1 Tax=Phascolomyces articulosus TaxID=60185 RepID=A0AAD5PEI0_9FUNG|nr:hypothetical protein BDA99DRAFT_560967 [Phascolomyces articulosus]